MDERPSEVVVPSVAGVEASVPRSEGAGPGSGGGSASAAGGSTGELEQRGREQARRLSGVFREQAIKRADRRKSGLASTIESFAVTISETGRNLEERGLGDQRRFTDGAADRLRGISRQLRESSSEDLLHRAGEGFRANPGWVLAGCFALGFFGARLLKG